MSRRYGRIPPWGDVGLIAAVYKKKNRIVKTTGEMVRLKPVFKVYAEKIAKRIIAKSVCMLETDRNRVWDPVRFSCHR
jgi:hypothetical protein